MHKYHFKARGLNSRQEDLDVRNQGLRSSIIPRCSLVPLLLSALANEALLFGAVLLTGLFLELGEQGVWGQEEGRAVVLRLIPGLSDAKFWNRCLSLRQGPQMKKGRTNQSRLSPRQPPLHFSWRAYSFFEGWASTSLGDHRSKVLLPQACLTLCNPIDGSPPGSSVYGNLQARILKWVAISFRRSSWPRDRTWVSRTAGTFFTIRAAREGDHKLGDKTEAKEKVGL